MNSALRLLLTVAVFASAAADAAAAERVVKLSGNSVDRISGGFEHCLGTRRHEVPRCPLDRHERSSMPGLVESVPLQVLGMLSRELGETTPADEAAHTRACGDGRPASPAFHALCALTSLEQRNFELLTLRVPNDGYSSYPEIRVSVSGVEDFLAHIDAARGRGGFQQLVSAAERAQDRLGGTEAGSDPTPVSDWLGKVRNQANYLSGRLETRPMLAAFELANEMSDAPETVDGVSPVLSTFARLALHLPRDGSATAVRSRREGLRRTSSSQAMNEPWQLLTDAWSRSAADEYRSRVRGALERAQLGATAASRAAVAEYAAAAMSEVTARAAQCALVCMRTAGLENSIPVPMPIETDMAIPFTFIN